MNFLKIFNTDCWFTLLVLLFIMEILKKKKALKMKKSSKNDQSTTGHFQSFFSSFFVLNLKKNPVNQLIKKKLALLWQSSLKRMVRFQNNLSEIIIR